MLPRSGGMNDQDQFEMSCFQAIRDGERIAEAERDRRVAQSGGPIAGLLTLMNLSNRNG